MPELMNTRVLLAKRPAGEPGDDCFTIDKVPVPELQEGEITLKVLYLSIDPYMRGRMNDGESYAKPVPIGGVMVGESVGVVVASRSDKYKVGDHLVTHQGWQSYITCRDDQASLGKVDKDLLPLQDFLGVAGMPGRTGYFGLLRLGKPKAGETLVVAAASGPVGSMVGQIAKMKGLHVVGIAGGPEKCAYVKQELGFDVVIDHREGNVAEELKKACPNGIDIYFENVGGEVTRAVAPLLNKGARAPICGMVSIYNATDMTKVETPFHTFAKLEHPPEHRFFVVTEWLAEWWDATKEIAGWIKEGKLKHKEWMVDGLDQAPELLRSVLRGRNFGKAIVRVAEED